MTDILEKIGAVIIAIIAIVMLFAIGVGLMSVDVAPIKNMGAAIVLGLLLAGIVAFAAIANKH
jgi:hypothetical protein